MVLVLVQLAGTWMTSLVNAQDVRSLNPVEHYRLNGNHAPTAPHQPQGPGEGDVGVAYTFWTNASDPDGDQLYYFFDWGDSTTGNWLGPFESGVNISASHIWHERGEYTIQVKDKDMTGAESNWSDSSSIMLAGPYLTFGNITGGHGLTVEIKNIGEMDARNITVEIQTVKGIFVKAIPDHYQIPLLSAGNSTEERVRLWGCGLGLFSDIPRVTLTANALDAKTRAKQVDIRLFGSFVKKAGESWTAEESYNGYTLYTPMMSTESFLINNSGAIVHSWNSSYRPALSVYLLENGNLLRTAFPGYNPRFWGGGIGGRVELFDWNGTRLWYFEYSNDQHCLHHDVRMLPNGDILMIAWEYKSAAEAIAKGRNPNTIPAGELWPDSLIEVRPSNNSGGTIVWEWHLWDHLIQDFDSTKENYGFVQEHPELVDINYGGRILADWTHINSVDYNEEYNQILVSVLCFDEIWVIDHSTTTEEAASHTGGRYGKGGDLLYRWGNPQTYRVGTASDQKLFGQHDAEWIKPGLPGAGNLLILNNGLGRPGGEYSSVEEIAPPQASNGTYVRQPGAVYGPSATLWNYTAGNPTDFYSVNLGSAQRLPNGNTLICSGPIGQFFEVTPEKEIVWKYENLIPDPLDPHVFKICRYGPEYPGLKFP